MKSRLPRLTLIYPALFCVACLSAACSDDSNSDAKPTSCPEGQHLENGNCVPNAPTSCPEGQHLENGNCVPNAPTSCPEGQHLENGNCVPNADAPVDPCQNVTCSSGTCEEGICVTQEMIAIQKAAENAGEDNIPTCDPNTFVDFCHDGTTVYCDQGMVMTGKCAEGCVVYQRTFHGITRQQSGCIDGGACATLNELKRECNVDHHIGQVLVTACQRTTRNELQYVSVEGYYCLGQCDAKNEQCQLTTSGELVECDPYDSANYACDGRDLTTCRLNSNLQGIVQNYRCAEACITEGGVAMCGFACDRENDTSTHCVYADSVEYEDSGHFICKKFDNGTLYSIWNGEYDFCETGCTAQTGLCHD